MACMLRDGQQNQTVCAESSCQFCGWNREEHIRRLALLEEKGLIEGPDGLMSLVLEAPKKVTEDEDT